jgi:hypothetical protein
MAGIEWARRVENAGMESERGQGKVVASGSLECGEMCSKVAKAGAALAPTTPALVADYPFLPLLINPIDARLPMPGFDIRGFCFCGGLQQYCTVYWRPHLSNHI